MTCGKSLSRIISSGGQNCIFSDGVYYKMTNWQVLAVFWFVAVWCCGWVQIDEFWKGSDWWVLAVVLCKDAVFFCGPDWWDLEVWWCVVVWRGTVTGGGCSEVLVPVQSVFFLCLSGDNKIRYEKLLFSFFRLVTIKLGMRTSFFPWIVWWQ